MKKLITCIGLILLLLSTVVLANATAVSNVESIVVEELAPTPEPTPTPEVTRVRIEFKGGRQAVYIVGDKVTLTSIIEGIGIEQLNIQYQWQCKAQGQDEWQNIAGATGTEYSFLASANDLNKSYRLIVSFKIAE